MWILNIRQENNCYFLSFFFFFFFFINVRTTIGFSHFRGEHVSDAVDGALHQQTPHQETEEHNIWEEGAEVHHLRQTDTERVK